MVGVSFATLWENSINKKADESYYVNNGEFVSAFKIKHHEKDFWIIFTSEKKYTILNEDRYSFWKAENRSIPFLDF